MKTIYSKIIIKILIQNQFFLTEKMIFNGFANLILTNSLLYIDKIVLKRKLAKK